MARSASKSWIVSLFLEDLYPKRWRGTHILISDLRTVCVEYSSFGCAAKNTTKNAQLCHQHKLICALTDISLMLK